MREGEQRVDRLTLDRQETRLTLVVLVAQRAGLADLRKKTGGFVRDETGTRLADSGD